MICAYTAATSRGKRRDNQDNMRVDGVPFVNVRKQPFLSSSFDDDGLHLFCVCDGIGGEYAGTVAAVTALRAVGQTVDSLDARADLRTIALSVAEAAQKRVTDYYLAAGMAGGSTICLAAIRFPDYCVLNIGDSPVFLYSAAEKSVSELSVRHNLETQKRLHGVPAMPGDECYLTAYLGDFQRTAAEMCHCVCGALCPGDAILLCSDGVSNACRPSALCKAIKRGSSARDLVAFAAAAPDADNCTAILLNFPG